MNRPRQQHYVTRAYLEGFAPERDRHLFVYTRGKTNPFRALPKNVAKIHNFYSAQRPDGTHDDRVEHMLQELIEDPGLHVIRRLLAGHYNISRPARGRLATLLAVQEYRIPWMRDQMEIFMTRMLQSFTSSMLAAPGVAEDALVKLGMTDQMTMLAEMRQAFQNGDVTITANPVASLHAMAYVLEPLVNAYFQMEWVILETTSVPFVTSDCPVHRYYVPVRPDLPYEGLLDKRVHVHFPLCRTKMLVLRHDRRRIEMIEDLLRRKRRREAQKAIDRATQIRHVRVNRADVEHINAHTMAMAARYVFSSQELPEAAELLKGDCMNMRQVFTDYPDGALAFRTYYPQHPFTDR